MKKSMAASFLTQEEQKKVTAAVQKAEKQTSGEIVPLITSKSYTYPLATHIGSMFLSLCLAITCTVPLQRFFNDTMDVLWCFLAIFFFFYFIFTFILPLIPGLHKLFISSRQIEEEVQEGALTSFFGEQLYKTEKQNGILLYISVFERKAWVLGDEGVNSAIPEDYWQEIIDKLLIEIKAGNQCNGLCRAIDDIGEKLQEYFPAQKNDEDELHNLLIRD